MKNVCRLLIWTLASLFNKSCRAENPNVVKTYQTYKGKNFTVLGISLDQAGARDKWLKRYMTTAWIGRRCDLKGWKNEAAQLYSVRAIPQNFLINPQGKIIAHDIRGEELNKKLQEIFKD
jgi:peroxiredoxin